MIKQAISNGTKSRRLKFDDSNDNDESVDNFMSSSEEEEDEEEQGDVIVTRNSVKIVLEAFLGYYAIVIGESH